MKTIMGILANLRAANVRRPFDAVLWWELRRVPFNAVLLTVSALSFVVIEGIGAQLVQPGEDVVEPMAAVVGGAIFIVGANICYTLGWTTELMWSGGDTSRTESMRSRIYRRGLTLSTLVAATPGVLVPLLWSIFGFH
jgi:hypothetical protein